MSAGKGDARRPQQISDDELAARWRATFSGTGHGRQGTGYDPGAVGYERQGRATGADTTSATAPVAEHQPDATTNARGET